MRPLPAVLYRRTYRRTGGSDPVRPPRARSGRRRGALALGFGRAADNDRPTGRLDRRDRRPRRAGHLDRDRRRQLAFREQANAVAGAAQHASSNKCRRVDRPFDAEASGVDSLLQPPEIDDLIILLEDLVVEAAFRQAAMQRRLAALEAVDRDAAAGGLPPAAAPPWLSVRCPGGRRGC